MRTKIITHTGSDFPFDEAERLGIVVLPDHVIFDGVDYKNVVEISPEEFYAKLKVCKNIPTSAHPSVGEMTEAFVEAAKDADEILFIAVTSLMSGTYACSITAAEIAHQQGVECPIYSYDSLQCSHAQAEMVREAHRLAQQGVPAAEIMPALDAYREKMGIYFILDTLKFAHKGGRIGAIKAVAADAMRLKPLLEFSDGLVRDFGIARSFKDGYNKLLERYKKEADFSKPVTIFHLEALDKVELLAEEIKKINPDVELRFDYVGAQIGIYAGPGGAGLAFVKK